jgi:hypothetical protein
MAEKNEMCKERLEFDKLCKKLTIAEDEVREFRKKLKAAEDKEYRLFKEYLKLKKV